MREKAGELFTFDRRSIKQEFREYPQQKMYLTLPPSFLWLSSFAYIAYLTHISLLFLTQLVKNRDILAHQPLNPILLRHFPNETVDVSQRDLETFAPDSIQLHQAD